MNVTELKEKLLTSLDLWADARISDMVKENPALAIPSVYMKRASHNIIAKHKDSWGKALTTLPYLLPMRTATLMPIPYSQTSCRC